MENKEILFKKALRKLGAPIRRVELNDEIMETLLEDAIELSEILVKNGNQKHKDFYAKLYFQASCKSTLGWIRGKFSGNLPIPGAEIRLDYESLVREGAREKRDVITLIMKYNEQ